MSTLSGRSIPAQVGSGSGDAPASLSSPFRGSEASRFDLSVVVVNFNGGELLQRCIQSVAADLDGLSAELFLVDNGSSDGSFEAACKLANRLSQGAAGEWPLLALRAIQNRANLGFAGANNVALRAASGRYLLLLNPDVLLLPGSLRDMVRYMDDHPEVGISGPRILLPNGRLDSPCRRSFKTPSIYLYKLLGLGRLFPHSRRFGRYYLSYLPEDRLVEVDAVIGAFLMMRRRTMEQVGLLDERFFMYCEDEDWCFRAKRAGWKVVYNPRAQVIHNKGSSASKRRARMIVQWHRSIWQFHRKNMASSYPLAVNGMVYLGMLGSLTASLALSAADELRSRVRGG